MHILLVFVFVITATFVAVAQSGDSLLIENSRPVNAERYRDIEGSPYYFKDWVIGRVLRSDALYIDGVLLNYNGFDRELEIKSGDRIYALDKKWHLRADVSVGENPSLSADHQDEIILQQGVHRKLPDIYGIILFTGLRYTLVLDFQVMKSEKAFRGMGRNDQTQQFSAHPSYYLKTDSELIELRLHRKRIAEAFRDDKRIDEFIQAEHLHMGNQKDLIRLVEFADTLELK